MLAIVNDTFDPVLLSIPENRFVMEHAGKPPAVIARIPLPADVNAKAVMPVLEHIYQLEEVAKHDKAPWTGVAAIKKQCQVYIEQREEWARLKARYGAAFPTFPTMAGWDSKGKPSLGATGSDSGRVRTYFDENGDRKPLAVALHGEEAQTFLPPWVKQTVQYDKLIVDDEKAFIRCPICEHTEKYDNESQSARNLAQGRMAKHLLGAKERIEAHRELHTKVYGR